MCSVINTNIYITAEFWSILQDDKHIDGTSILGTVWSSRVQSRRPESWTH